MPSPFPAWFNHTSTMLLKHMCVDRFRASTRCPETHEPWFLKKVVPKSLSNIYENWLEVLQVWAESLFRVRSSMLSFDHHGFLAGNA